MNHFARQIALRSAEHIAGTDWVCFVVKAPRTSTRRGDSWNRHLSCSLNPKNLFFSFLSLIYAPKREKPFSRLCPSDWSPQSPKSNWSSADIWLPGNELRLGWLKAITTRTFRMMQIPLDFLKQQRSGARCWPLLLHRSSAINKRRIIESFLKICLAFLRSTVYIYSRVSRVCGSLRKANCQCVQSPAHESDGEEKKEKLRKKPKQQPSDL